MKKALLPLILIVALCACLMLAGCSTDDPAQNPNDTSVDPNAETTAPDTTEAPETTVPPVTTTEFVLDENAPVIYNVVEKKLIRSMFDWNRGKTTTDTGETAHWDNPKAKLLQINLINVFPPGVNSDMTYVHGGSLVPQYGEYIMQYNAAGLAQAHSQGLEVISSMPMILINRDVYKAAGMNVMDYCALYPSGIPYDGGCLNNPNFRKLLYDYTMLSAKNGYDGMFPDGSPYSYGPGYCCCCQYCKDAWAEFVMEKLGRSEPLPMRAPDFQTDVSRCFFEFRAETFISFVLELRDAAREIKPGFDFWPNTGLNGALVMYYLNAGLDTVITEFGGVNIVECGEESTLYLYRQFEAIYEHLPLLSQHNSIAEQAPNPYQFYTAYAEALAGGGNLMVPVGKGSEYLQILASYNKLINANEDAFTKSTSIADTAVFFSLNDMNAYSAKKTGLIPFKNNPSRRAATLLAANGIAYDYINAEKKTLAAEDFKQYKTIVFTDLHLLDHKVEAMVEEFLKGGGQLLILGSSFATNYIGENGYDYPAYEYDVLEKWTGTKFADMQNDTVYTCGEGKVIVARDYATDLTDAEAITAKENLIADFEQLGMFDQIRVDTPEDLLGAVETTIRSDATGQRWWVHLINYGTEDHIPTTPYTVTISIPEGETVYDVVPASAFRSVKKIDMSWEFKDGKLTVTGCFDIHTMLTIYKR